MTGYIIITEILHWIISPFIYSCADHTDNPIPAVDVSQGLKWTYLGPVSQVTKHISLQVQMWEPIPASALSQRDPWRADISWKSMSIIDF